MGSPILISSDFVRKIKSGLNSRNSTYISRNKITLLEKTKQFSLDLNVNKLKPYYIYWRPVLVV